MSRRALIAALALSACTTATSAPVTTVSGPATPVRPVPYEQTRPNPGQPAPTPAAATFDAWRDGFVQRAAARGLDRSFVQAQLQGVAPIERVVRLDQGQPEFSRPISAYVNGAVTAARVAEGRRRIDADPRFAALEARYGVPVEVLVGIWAMESDFGRIQGDFDVVSAFATLAYEGRRRDWAESQLMDTLRIISTGRASRERLKGSWAGAMGQTQFIPENYLKLAQDGDGDGAVDIWSSDLDALASAANLLKTAGWKPDQEWAVEVVLPEGFDYYLSETARLTPTAWDQMGVKRADGRAWTGPGAAEEAVLLLPTGAQGPAFLALPNHYVIRRYNNSVAYALAVGLLGSRIKGETVPQRAWPIETPLSRADRVAAQTALTRLGFDAGTPDGVVGAGTRRALRDWQKARGIPADGYLSPEMVARLRAEAGA